MTLLEWQKRLAAHFEALAGERSAANRPVFVLEHGLEGPELEALQRAVRSAAAPRKPESMAPLPWIVYATELGYRYSGDEYWQTFEDETPGWAGYWERGWLRDQFVWFHRKFHGFHPTGAWAQHFSIICWPIANAVLPRDLQLQLARILFDMRYRLNADLFNNPEKLGREIADRAWNASARLQNLCEEPLLIGQIGTALLLEGQAGAASLILPATLRRIGGDLGREQQAREWLKRARGVAVERVKIRGLAPSRTAAERESSRWDVADEVRRSFLEPSLVLRPSVMRANSWTVLLQVPNMTPLMDIVPEARSILTESRCEVAGAAGRPLARGRLIQGTQQIPLAKWPQAGQPLLNFEKKNPHVEYIVRTCFSMVSKPPWLFRVASDGLGYEIRGAGIRPGQSYLLLGAGPAARELPFAAATTLECDGIDGVVLSAPPKFESGYIEALKTAGVGLAPSIRVWPAGIGAIGWDGKGRSEWLVTEHPTFAIKADRTVAFLIARWNTGQADLGALAAGATIFVSCPLLQPGNHEIGLFAKDGPFVQEATLGTLTLHVRAPRAWGPGKGNHGPLLVDVEPINPTLEQLREGRVDVTIRGPKGRELDVIARIFERGNETPVFNRRLAKIVVPMNSSTWNKYVQRHLLELPEVADFYDVATHCDIELSGAELGSISLRFERQSAPARWAFRKGAGRKQQISIVSEAIQDETVEVESRTFENPDVESRKERMALNAWTETPPKGGLLIARVGKFASAVVSAPQVHGLRDLQVAVSIKRQPRSLQSVLATLESINLWASARLSGSFLSGTRQRAVLRALALHLHSILCGENWERIETSIDECAPDMVLKFFVSKPQELAIAKSIMEELPALLELSPRERTEWLYDKVRKPFNLVRVHPLKRLRDGTEEWRTVGQDSPMDPQLIVEFALRLASDPAHIAAGAQDSVRRTLEKLWNQPAISRMARLMVAVVDRQSAIGNQGIGYLYPGWVW